jgi:hypothetical protein
VTAREREEGGLELVEAGGPEAASLEHVAS